MKINRYTIWVPKLSFVFMKEEKELSIFLCWAVCACVGECVYSPILLLCFLFFKLLASGYKNVIVQLNDREMIDAWSSEIVCMRT